MLSPGSRNQIFQNYFAQSRDIQNIGEKFDMGDKTQKQNIILLFRGHAGQNARIV